MRKVSYDFSAADSLQSIPVAVEALQPQGSTDALAGWSGINGDKISEQDLKDKFQNFTNNPNQSNSLASGWGQLMDPTKTPIPQPNNGSIKIAGGYNYMELTNNLPISVTGHTISSSNFANKATVAASRKTLVDRWNAWNTTVNCQVNSYGRSIAFCQRFQNSARQVMTAFQPTVAAAYKTADNFHLITNILGYTADAGLSLPQDPDNKITTDVIALLSGVPNKSDITSQNYDQGILYPPANSMYSLDPYVTFIHRDLGLNIYAFSIDDAVGNIQVRGPQYTGLAIDIGSIKSLPNQAKFKVDNNPNTNAFTPLPQPSPGAVESHYFMNTTQPHTTGTVRCTNGKGKTTTINIDTQKRGPVRLPIYSQSGTMCNVDLTQGPNANFKIKQNSGGSLAVIPSNSTPAGIVATQSTINLPG